MGNPFSTPWSPSSKYSEAPWSLARGVPLVIVMVVIGAVPGAVDSYRCPYALPPDGEKYEVAAVRQGEEFAKLGEAYGLDAVGEDHEPAEVKSRATATSRAMVESWLRLTDGFLWTGVGGKAL